MALDDRYDLLHRALAAFDQGTDVGKEYAHELALLSIAASLADIADHLLNPTDQIG